MKLRNGKTTGSDFQGFIGYKVCRDVYSDNLKIVTLQVPVTSKHNIHREGIVDRQRAKYRCSDALVIKIEPPGPAHSLRDEFFFYKVGDKVEVDDFVQDVNRPCASGIHFFLDKEVAHMNALVISGQDGKVKKWDSNGVLRHEYQKRNGKIYGRCRCYDENGVLQSDGYITNGKPDGIWKHWHKNGILKSEASYQQGKLYGSKNWNEKGTLVHECVLSYNSKGSVTIHKKLYCDGSGRVKQEVCLVGGKYHGEWKLWHENGQLHVVTSFKAGKKHGVTKAWHENGVQRMQCLYDDDRRQGPVLEWHMNGIPSVECHYADGLKNGRWREWDEEGRLIIDCMFKDDIIFDNERGLADNLGFDN